MEICLLGITVLEQGYRANFWKKYIVDLKNKQFTLVKKMFVKGLLIKKVC